MNRRPNPSGWWELTHISPDLGAGIGLESRNRAQLCKWLTKGTGAVNHAPTATILRGDGLRFHAQARAHARAHHRPDAPGRAGWLQLRLAVRLARAVARSVPAADGDGAQHHSDAPRDVRHQSGHARAERDGERARGTRRAEWRTDGPRHRSWRLGEARDGQTADHPRPARGGDRPDSRPCRGPQRRPGRHRPAPDLDAGQQAAGLDCRLRPQGARGHRLASPTASSCSSPIPT